MPDFAGRGAAVVAICVDSPKESLDLSRGQGYTFPILSDPNAAMIRAYGVVHEHGGDKGQDIARPAEFLLDPTGTIRWENLTENLLARLQPETVLQAIDGLSAAK